MAQLGSTVVAGSLTVTDDVNLVKPLPISSGGTGQSTGVNACNVLLNSLTTGSSDPVDDDYYIAQYVGGGTTTTTYHRRPVSKLWNYIKSKLGISTGTTSYLRNDGTWATPDDHITTASTTGTGNAVTAISADANGALTVTKGSTFLTSHQTVKQDGVTGATVNRFGTCSTAADTAAKTVSITTGTFTLETGAKVSVKFSNANTADNPTLNVNSKGAKNIFHKGAQIKTDSSKNLLTGVCDFIYDGTQWHLEGTSYGNESAANGGTDLSLVTTGEKYTWDNKQAKLTNPVTGTGTSGYLAKFNGSTTVTNGPQLGSSTTTFLRNDGSWQVPSVGGDLGSWTPVMTGVSRSGATFTKTTNTSAWDSQVYSKECYNHCMVAFSASQTNGEIMIGLDANPSQDANWTNLDYAIYLKTDGTFDIRESNSTKTVTGNTYTASDTFSICFFNGNVIYRKGTTVLRTVARSATTPLYLDSSFKTYNKSITNVSFAAMPDDLSAATSSTLGTIKVGYSNTGKNYKVQLDSSNNAYVNVPWTDTHEPSAFIKSASVDNDTLTLTPNTGSAVSVTKTSLGLGNVDNTADANKSVSSAGKWTTARNISISDSDGTNTGTAVSVDGSAAKTLKLPATIKAALTGTADYSKTLIGATCSIAVGTAAKTVSISGFTLESGRSIRVLFSNGNSAATPTLNVNSTGAKNIKIYRQGTKYQLTTSTSVTNRVRSAMDAGTILDLYYDGTDWLIVGNPVLKTTVSSTGAYVFTQYYANGLRLQLNSTTSGYSFRFDTNTN